MFDLIARETVERFDDQDVEAVRHGVGHEFSAAGARFHARRTRDTFVRVARDDFVLRQLLREALTDAHLIGDRSFLSFVGGKPTI
nr:hypothetical protein [Caballeronia sp. ATUFL_M1_KS5A]